MPQTTALPIPRITTLANGIRVVTQNISGMQSASIGIRIDSSTRNETSDIAGASHFIEHLLFKGTKKQSADQIMEKFDALGASANAYTCQEEVFYYAVSLASAIPATFELLADMFVNATFPPNEVEKERDVVLQEISMIQDNPSRFIYHQFHRGFCKAHPLGQSVLGTVESISSVQRDALLRHKCSQYLTEATIVAAAGNVEHAMIVDLTQEFLKDLPQGNITQAQPIPDWSPALGEQLHHQRAMEQTQFFMGYQMPPAGSEYRYAQAVFNQILGSGMSSRLFREVRERRGLAYSVYSFISSYSDLGALLIFAGTSSARAQEAINVCHNEVMRFCAETTDEETLMSSKEQIRSKCLMSLDDCSSQVRRLADSTSLFGAPEPIKNILEGVASVSARDVRNFVKSLLFGATPRVESVGPGEGPSLPQ